MPTSDLIQIALLCVQSFVGIVQAVTTAFFIRSVGISRRQEEDMREQLSLAREQIALGQKQMDLMANQYQESLRPLLAVTFKQSGSNLDEIEIRNEGLGPALYIECNPSIQSNGTVIGGKSAVSAFVRRLPPGVATRLLFTLTYQSLDGLLYSTSFQQTNAFFKVVDYRQLNNAEAVERAKTFRDGFSTGARYQNSHE
jgi:hypothetical protein